MTLKLLERSQCYLYTCVCVSLYTFLKELIEFAKCFTKIMPQLRSFHFLAKSKSNNAALPTYKLGMILS
jgi:hypothetical protein